MQWWAVLSNATSFLSLFWCWCLALLLSQENLLLSHLIWGEWSSVMWSFDFQPYVSRGWIGPMAASECKNGSKTTGACEPSGLQEVQITNRFSSNADPQMPSDPGSCICLPIQHLAELYPVLHFLSLSLHSTKAFLSPSGGQKHSSEMYPALPLQSFLIEVYFFLYLCSCDWRAPITKGPAFMMGREGRGRKGLNWQLSGGPADRLYSDCVQAVVV